MEQFSSCFPCHLSRDAICFSFIPSVWQSILKHLREVVARWGKLSFPLQQLRTAGNWSERLHLSDWEINSTKELQTALTDPQWAQGGVPGAWRCPSVPGNTALTILLLEGGFGTRGFLRSLDGFKRVGCADVVLGECLSGGLMILEVFSKVNILQFCDPCHCCSGVALLGRSCSKAHTQIKSQELEFQTSPD